jgi:hypothetical protein
MEMLELLECGVGGTLGWLEMEFETGFVAWNLAQRENNKLLGWPCNFKSFSPQKMSHKSAG